MQQAMRMQQRFGLAVVASELQHAPLLVVMHGGNAHVEGIFTVNVPDTASKLSGAIERPPLLAVLAVRFVLLPVSSLALAVAV